MATTWLSAHLGRKSQHPKFDKAIERLLTEMLNKGPKWRKLDTLIHVTGLSAEHTKEYLIEIGARGSETGGDRWGLISRNPLSEIATAD
ncbi:hypothetical protein GON01_06490 [Sphingomonas sp. MAH-20]|uniref:Uncharacterized protein n=1 Tax=Sphingomonas horti TaxID=2682842 RepID=A0A6I4J254_9SPHN|nr:MULTISPECIES: hypothetical protein [Sphingomonas]MBA2920645.1 hypothetical protein [Sphingomonas sp. CGMCC 1.13658]MVO77581.1 hypothetical protein [Sphingomonas horti]